MNDYKRKKISEVKTNTLTSAMSKDIAIGVSTKLESQNTWRGNGVKVRMDYYI